MHLDRIPDLLTDQVDRVRDRTAEAVGSNEGSVLRELSKLGRKLDGTEKHLAERLDDIAAATAGAGERLDELEFDLDSSTTWPRRLFWITVGLGAGAAAAYLADPDRGQQRRQEIVGQAQERVHAVTDDVSQRARDVKDEVVDRAQDVKDQAVSSAKSVAEEAQHAAEDVRSEAQHAAEDVKTEAQHAAEGVKREIDSDSSDTNGAPTAAPAPITPPPTPRR